MKIAVIGAGQMGAGIAYTALRAADQVALFDISQHALTAGAKRIEGDTLRAVELGKSTDDEAVDLRRRLAPTLELGDAVRDADVVFESAPESFELKREIIAEIEASSPASAVIATNTSAISITALMGALADPGRGVGTHFFLPVRSMRLVEIAMGHETTTSTVERIESVLASMGKTTVRVKDVPGLVTSRINAMIGNEAFDLLFTGVASAEEIDVALKVGLNHPMGPLELADMIGLDTRLSVLQELRHAYGEKFRPSPLLEQLVAAGRLGRKTGAGVYRYGPDGQRLAAPSVEQRG